MTLATRIGRLEMTAGIGTTRPWPAEWDGTPEAAEAMRRMLEQNPDAVFRECAGGDA